LNITLMLIRLSRDDAAFRYFALAYAWCWHFRCRLTVAYYFRSQLRRRH
jgi:hypothetical protein